MIDSSLVSAIAAAQERRLETAQAVPLFRDLHAEQFVEEAVRDLPADHVLSWVQRGESISRFLPQMSGYVPLRTRYFDDAICRAQESGCRQIVILGAGLDSRAFRLVRDSGCRVFEVDLPKMFRFKEPVIQANAARSMGGRVCVATDLLCADWYHALLAMGFEGGHRTLWLAEAVLYYLPPSVVSDVLRSCQSISGAESQLVLELTSPSIQSGREFALGRKHLSRINSTMMPASDDPLYWLKLAGWQLESVNVEAWCAGLGRKIPAVLDSRRTGTPDFILGTASRL